MQRKYKVSWEPGEGQMASSVQSRDVVEGDDFGDGLDEWVDDLEK